MKEQILKRLNDLYLILRYTSEKTALLTTGERICVNQERAALFRLLDGDDTGFIQSEAVQKKTDKILQLIKIQNWKPKEDTLP